MEGVPASSTGDPAHDPPIRQTPPVDRNDPIFLPRPSPSRQRSIRQPSLDPPIESEFQTETYIVQIPKDQIFGVPSPENAIIAERYQNLDKKGGSGCKPSLCVVIILAALAVAIGAIIATLHILFSPQVPGFSVLYVHVKNPPPSSNHGKTKAAYEIGFKAKNPNARMQILYGSNGDAKLSYKGHKIGSAEFPGLNQDSGGSTNVQLGLTGSNGPLPLEIERSMQDTEGKEHVSLSLDMNVPVKLNVGAVTLWTKTVHIACHFEVSSLGTGKDVLSQQCKTQFQ